MRPENEEHGLRVQLTAALLDCHALKTKLATANARADAAEGANTQLATLLRRSDAETLKAQEALAAARRECEGILSAMRATHVMCGVCETDIYGEDGILVSSQVADCPPCKMLRDTLAGKGPCESTMSSDKLFYHCTLRKDHVGPHADREIAEWTDETHRDAAIAAPAAAAGEEGT